MKNYTYQNKHPCDGTSRSPEAHTPEPAGTQEPQEGGKAESGRPNTTTGTPSPAAKAAEAQEPDPRPQKQREEAEDGTRPDGHGTPGKTRKPQPWPETDTARTSATERRTNAARPRPKADTENTDAAGQDARTLASSPAAHPTTTPRPEADTADTRPEISGEKDEESDREPEKPTKASIATRPEPKTPTRRMAEKRLAEGKPTEQNKTIFARNSHYVKLKRQHYYIFHG